MLFLDLAFFAFWRQFRRIWDSKTEAELVKNHEIRNAYPPPLAIFDASENYKIFQRHFGGLGARFRIWELFGMILGRFYFQILGRLVHDGLEAAFPKLNGRSKCVWVRILPRHFQELVERHDSFFATANHPPNHDKIEETNLIF